MIKKSKLVESARIEEKLDDLVRYHEELVNDLPAKEEFGENRLARRGIEKTIELIADTVVDVALLLVSELGLEKPQDSRDAITQLEKNKIITGDTATRVKDLVSFRNLLVHRYGIIDDKLEYESIEEGHDDVIKFVKEIERFLKNNS